MDCVHAGKSEKGWKGSGQSWTEICELTTSGLVPLGHLFGAGVRLGKKEALNFISYSPSPSSTSIWSLLICSFFGVAEIIQNTTKSFIPLTKIHVRWVYLLLQQVLIETQKELEEAWWVRQPGWWAPAQRQGVCASGELDLLLPTPDTSEGPLLRTGIAPWPPQISSREWEEAVFAIMSPPKPRSNKQWNL